MLGKRKEERPERETKYDVQPPIATKKELRLTELLGEADKWAHSAAGRYRHPTRKTRREEGQTPFDCLAKAFLAQNNAIRVMAGLREVEELKTSGEVSDA